MFEYQEISQILQLCAWVTCQQINQISPSQGLENANHTSWTWKLKICMPRNKWGTINTQTNSLKKEDVRSCVACATQMNSRPRQATFNVHMTYPLKNECCIQTTIRSPAMRFQNPKFRGHLLPRRCLTVVLPLMFAKSLTWHYIK